MATTARSTDEQELLAQVSTDELMNSTRTIAQWERYSGTPDEAKAFDWIEAKLQGYGFATTRYQHPALVSWPEEASLVITPANGEPFEVDCKTHAFGASTPDEGLTGELVSAGRGSADELAGLDLAGKIALVDGLVAPHRNLALEATGVAASIWIAGTHLHERGLSPVWGTPTPETAHLLPKTPSVSVKAEDGQRIKAALEAGPAQVTLKAKVHQAWAQLPLLIADIKPATTGPDAHTFVMLSGHVDSWYYGAMDNGSANATQIEVGRILAGRRDQLRRGLRLAFWSGHSHARYAGSAWYADNAWQDLHDNCVAHINIDSVGAKEATVLSQGNSMEVLREFVSDAIEAIAGQRLDPRRFGRSGDQSFWGHGSPAALMSLSEHPPENADPVLLALHSVISGGESKSGGLGWWWHLPEDTIDKIDPDNLHRDASIYVLLLYRLCTARILPVDYRATARDISANVAKIQEAAGEHFDLSPATDALAELSATLDRLYAALDGVSDDETAGAVNRALQEIGWALIPVDYTKTGGFDHDLAIPTSPLPGLQQAGSLASLEPDSDQYHFLRTRLVRERNRLVHGIITARRAAEEALAQLSG
jgi:hypothetical protein